MRNVVPEHDAFSSNFTNFGHGGLFLRGCKFTFFYTVLKMFLKNKLTF